MESPVKERPVYISDKCFLKWINKEENKQTQNFRSLCFVQCMMNKDVKIDK